MRLVAVLSAVLMVAACTNKSEPVGPTITSTTAPSLRVIGQVPLMVTTWARLSSDGRNVLFNNGANGLCLRRVDGRNKDRCFGAQDPTGFLDAESAAWSPDGRKLAVTEAYRLGLEPDIHVVEVESGRLTNLTDDGIAQQGAIVNGGVALPGGALVDLYPSWSADSTQVRFLRKDATGVAVMTAPALGGAPTRLGTLDVDVSTLREVAWSADSIAWVAGSPAGGTDVRVTALAGDGQHKALDGDYQMVSFSADGAYLLVDQQDQHGDAVVGKARVVPTRGGDPVPVATGGVRYPTWAAKGHALAYVEDDDVKVVDEPGATPKVLYEGDDEVGAADHRSLGWAPGIMLVQAGTNAPLVLRIGG